MQRPHLHCCLAGKAHICPGAEPLVGTCCLWHTLLRTSSRQVFGRTWLFVPASQGSLLSCCRQHRLGQTPHAPKLLKRNPLPPPPPVLLRHFIERALAFQQALRPTVLA